MHIKKNNSCCSCSDGCCGSSAKPEINKREIVIDFLYLDVTVCERCQGTDKSLDEAIGEVANILAATGIDVKVNKINVLNEELAKKHKFLTSPTIRINGKDIQMDLKKVFVSPVEIYAEMKLIAVFGFIREKNIQARQRQ